MAWFGSVVDEVGGVGTHDSSLFASLSETGELFVGPFLPQFAFPAFD